ncbi:MAG: AMP-binding protein [Dehalococcoidia bacterium]|nr:AMP-binding protein [Dehalococcoidia bacterium]
MIDSFYSPKASQSKYWNPYGQTLSRDELDKRHLSKIQKLIKFAYDNTPFYRDLYGKAGFKPEDIRTWDDFHHRVPLVDKPDFMREQDARPPIAMPGLPREHQHAFLMTSGTTGSPMRMAYSRYDEVSSGDLFATAWWDGGVRAGDSYYFCFTFGPWAALWAAYWGTKRLGGIVYSGASLSTEDRIKQILAFKPTVVLGTPTYLLHMAEVAEKMGVDLHQAGVKMLSGGGEPGFNVPVTRRVLLDKWGAERTGDIYGLSETCNACVECGKAGSGGVHVHEWHFHGYAMSPDTLEPVKEGEIGEHIITTYRRIGQIFIKYRTHDLVQFDYHPDHGCGWSWAFLPGAVLARTDFMVIIRGVNVFPTAIENLLGQVPGASHHYEIHIDRVEGLDKILVKFEAKDGETSDNFAGIAARAKALYHEKLSVGVDVEVIHPGALPRYDLKAKRMFDHRPKDVLRKLEGQS